MKVQSHPNRLPDEIEELFCRPNDSKVDGNDANSDEVEEMEKPLEEEVLSDEEMEDFSTSSDSSNNSESSSPPKRRKIVISEQDLANLPRKSLPSRATRGARIEKMLNKEQQEADAAFWGQEAWNVDVEDEDYSMEEEEIDIPDDDFDLEEIVDDEEDPENIDSRSVNRKKKKSVYKEPYTIAKNVKKKKKVATTTSSPFTNFMGPIERTMRTSTKKKTTESVNFLRKDQEQNMVKPKKKEHKFKRFTQEELLREAVETEIKNKRSLNQMEKLEEEKKREDEFGPRRPQCIPTTRFYSKKGIPNTITFLNMNAFPALFHQKKPLKRDTSNRTKYYKTGSKHRDELKTEDNTAQKDGKKNDDATLKKVARLEVDIKREIEVEGKVHMNASNANAVKSVSPFIKHEVIDLTSDTDSIPEARNQNVNGVSDGTSTIPNAALSKNSTTTTVSLPFMNLREGETIMPNNVRSSNLASSYVSSSVNLKEKLIDQSDSHGQTNSMEPTKTQTKPCINEQISTQSITNFSTINSNKQQTEGSVIVGNKR